LTIDQLTVLQAIVETGSFRAAAARLNKSQPALSVSIKNLESEYGIEIFDRSTYRPKLTEQGRVILLASKSVLNAVQRMDQIGRELGDLKIETAITVAVDPLIDLNWIELIALECARPAAPVRLVLTKTLLDGSIKHLVNGTADLALAPAPTDPSAVEMIPIQEVKLVTSVSKRLLAEKHQADLDFLSQHPQIFVYENLNDESPPSQLPRALHTEGQKIYVPDHFTKLRMISAGIGWGRISTSELAADKTLVAVPEKVSPSAQFKMCAMRAKHRGLGPIARQIWNVFEKKGISNLTR
jgi:DNA-binding transcriptional LysR family regulator